MRQLVRQKGQEFVLNGENIWLKSFEEFKKKVLNTFEEWEVKAEDISNLSKRYE